MDILMNRKNCEQLDISTFLNNSTTLWLKSEYSDSKFKDDKKAPNYSLISLLQGRLFVCNKSVVLKSGLECSEYYQCYFYKTLKCPAKLTYRCSASDRSQKILYSQGKVEHSHDLDINHLQLFLFKTYIRELAKCEYNMPRPTVELGLTLFPRASLNSLVVADDLIKWLCEMRSRLNIKSRESSPPSHRCSEVSWDHPEFHSIQPRTTITGELFLRFDGYYGNNPNNRVVIFSTDHDLSCLEKSNRLYCDATFENCPRQWAQLLTLHGSYCNPSIPLVYILLPNKTFLAYNFALNQLLQLLSNYNPRFITTDFEVGLLKAFCNNFNGFDFICCFVHLLRNLRKNMPKSLLTLMKLSDKDQSGKQVATFRRIIRLLWNLAFVPAQDIKWVLFI